MHQRKTTIYDPSLVVRESGNQEHLRKNDSSAFRKLHETEESLRMNEKNSKEGG
jgi:hypothetical protein